MELRESLPRHIDKFRKEKSHTEEMASSCWRDNIYLQKEAMENLGSEEFRTLKRIAVKDLNCDLMIDDEAWMSVLDRLCYLEKKVRELEKRH